MQNGAVHWARMKRYGYLFLALLLSLSGLLAAAALGDWWQK